MKRAAYLLVVMFASVAIFGCESSTKTDTKSDTKAMKMDCCGDMSCCKGMKTDGKCSADCKMDCCK